MGAAQVQSLLHALHRGDLSTLGRTCSLAGDMLASMRSTLHSLYTPSGARTISKLTDRGFVTALSATDECGIAADSGAKRDLRVVERDFQAALRLLHQGEKVSSVWAAAAS
jgi:hypothetical protein